jgi:hypothetical protein
MVDGNCWPELSALRRALNDASAELQCRVEMGEFDNLGDMQLGDLHTLGQRMAQWAALVLLIEQREGTPIDMKQQALGVARGAFGPRYIH